jgi:hypothetical protein
LELALKAQAQIPDRARNPDCSIVPTMLAAARNNVPAVYGHLSLPQTGFSYGTDPADLWRRAAPYVDRILRGAKPSDPPVQLPTKFEMVLNLKTAKALGLAVVSSGTRIFVPPNLA